MCTTEFFAKRRVLNHNLTVLFASTFIHNWQFDLFLVEKDVRDSGEIIAPSGLVKTQPQNLQGIAKKKLKNEFLLSF